MVEQFRIGVRTFLGLALGVVSASCLSQQILGAKEVLRRQQDVEQKRNSSGNLLLEYVRPKRPSAPMNTSEWAQQSLIAKFDLEEGNFAIMNRLPSPEYWPAIDAIYRNQDAPLPYKVLGAYLVGDRARLRSLVLEAGDRDRNHEEVWELMLALGQCWSDKELVSLAFVNQVERMKRAQGKGLDLYTGPISTIRLISHRTPGLVRILGREKAKEMYRLYFRNLQMPIEIMSRDDYEVILELFRTEGASFPFPHFEVIQTISAGDLYVAMDKRFPGEDEPNKSYAFYYYVLANVLRGNGDSFLTHAKDIASIRFTSMFVETILRSFDIEEELSSFYSDPKKAQNAFDFFEKALRGDPSVHLWPELCDAGVAAGQRNRLIAILTDAAEKEGVVSPIGFERRPPELLRGVASTTETSTQTADRMLAHMKAGHGEANEAAKMGQLLNRQDLTDIGVKNLLRELIKEGNDLMFQTQRYVDIENEYINEYNPEPSSLVHVYSALGRHQDVIDVLNLSHHWRSNDLKDEQDRYGVNLNLHLGVAKALLATGDRQSGLNVLRWSLRSRTKVDEAYELLLDTLGEAMALRELEWMELQDQFDNRPPLWRAKVLLKLGRLDEAERAAKKSIEIDQSDEDIEPGRRMAAHEVLAEVLEAKKRPEDAAKQRKIVEATRLSEKADLYADAGLGSDAIRIYREALVIDPESCRTYLRLGEALFKGGHYAEAGAEYRRGFELLPKYTSRNCSIMVAPDLFNRNEISTRIGDEVFGAMVKNRPGNPRALYLLGLVRYGQNRKEESQDLMRRAIAVDPKFIRAHKALFYPMGSIHYVAPEVEQSSLMALQELDNSTSFMGHGYGYRILDAGAMFRCIERRQSTADSPLYLLPAARGKTRDSQAAPPGQFLSETTPMREIALYIAAAGGKA